MGYFDQIVDRRGTSCIKWDFQGAYGQQNGLLPFWIADMDLPTVPAVMEAVKTRCDHPVIGYTHTPTTVYQAISDWWKRHYHCYIPTDWMIMSYGVVTGISFALETLLEKGDKVLVFTPVYDPFFAVVKNGGYTLVDCPLILQDNRFVIEWTGFENALKDGVKAVLLCNPHNPVGRVWTQQELNQLADLCAEYGVYVLSDEIHADFGLVRPYTCACQLKSILDKLVVFTAVSKTFNLAGLGSSCIFVPNEQLRNRIQQTFLSRWMHGPDALALTAIEAAYTHGDQWLEELLMLLRENQACICAFVSEQMPRIKLTEHEGTFLMWMDMRCFGMSSIELSQILAKEYGLALGIGSRFGSQADGYMRFNIGCPKCQIEEGLQQLKKMYDTYSTKSALEASL